MDLQLKQLRLPEAAALNTPALLLLVADGFAPGTDGLSVLLARSQATGDFNTEAGHLLPAYAASGVQAQRLWLAGIGDGGAASVRKAVAAAVAAVRRSPAQALTLCFAQPASAAALAAAAQAAADAAYEYTATKSSRGSQGSGSKGGKNAPGKSAKPLKQLTLAAPQVDAPLKAAFAQASAIAQGVQLAREWANRPGNHATPTLLAGAARQLAKLPRISCDILGPKDVAKLGMGAFQAVAQGSAQQLRFIVLRYQGAAKADAPVALVGKGITFDTGGISLKPAADMDEMKFDMGGAASVLGTFRALGELQPALNVLGLIPACENMPGGSAVKPGDVVTSMSGQTIEILNTDAEGRLVLCDALAYADRFKPRAVIDIATLTGACVIALGGLRSGLFSNDDALAAALLQAGDAALDPAWRMPLDDEYAEGLKTNFADVANVAGRAAGSVTAAKFLQRFTGAWPWAHLDIAGTAWKSGAAKGATGRPVGLLVHYLLGLAKPAQPTKSAVKPAARAAKTVKPAKAARPR